MKLASLYSTALRVCVMSSMPSLALCSPKKSYPNRQEVKTRQSIVDLFLARFTLSDNEVNALCSSSVPVGSTFFAAMDRAKAIRDDCRVLMVGEDSPSKAGYDLTTTTLYVLNSLIKRQSRYHGRDRRPPRKGIRQTRPIVQFRVPRHGPRFLSRSVQRANRVHAAPPLPPRAPRVRAPSPPSKKKLHTKTKNNNSSEALTVLAQTRQAATLSSFTSALTTGGTGTRPIELHAHDALRYIGDMLAWVHQAIAAEREFLETLLGIDAGARMPGAVRAPAHAADEWLGELLDAAVAGLCGPLRARVLQTVRAQESALNAYKVARLLQFYALTMARTLGARALLTTTLNEYVFCP
jgi:hypothetical protein